MDEQVSAQRARLEDEAEALVSAVAEYPRTFVMGLLCQGRHHRGILPELAGAPMPHDGRVRADMVPLGPANRGSFRSVAAWPEGRCNLKHLTKKAERTLTERRGLVPRGELLRAISRTAITKSVSHRGALCLARRRRRVGGCPEVRIETARDNAAASLGSRLAGLLFSRKAVSAEKATRERIQAALDLVTTSVGHEGFLPRRWRW
jgi:hypothetical protein